MSKRGIMGCLGILILWAGSLAWADAPVPVPSAKVKSKAQSAVPSAAQSAAPIRIPSLPSIAQVTLDPGAGAAAPSADPSAAKPPKAPSSGSGKASGAPKASLADAFIAQNTLRVYLDRPASVTVYNSRGQQVAHLDSRRAMEAVPLQGITTGFIYLTVRTAQGELTRKLVYTGK